MAYRACPPPAALAPYVDAFWEVTASSKPVRQPGILPDGCLDIAWEWDAAPGTGPAVGQARLLGTLTRPVVPAGGGSTWFGIRFRPAGLAWFAPEPLLHTQDAVVELAAWAPALARRLACRELATAATFAARCEAAGRVLLGLHGRVAPPPPRLWHAMQQLQAVAGSLRVGQAAGLACLSERQFARRVTDLVGVAPKQLAELLRFRATCQRLRAAPAEPLAAVALAAGYHDAAHLARDFRRYAGQTPARYRVRLS